MSLKIIWHLQDSVHSEQRANSAYPQYRAQPRKRVNYPSFLALVSTSAIPGPRESVHATCVQVSVVPSQSARMGKCVGFSLCWNVMYILQLHNRRPLRRKITIHTPF